MGRPRGLTIGQPAVSGRQCVMRERDKPAPRQRFRQQQGYGPVVEDAAGQGHGRYCVMGRAEGTVRQQWMAGIRQTCDRPDLCGFQRLLPGHVRRRGCR